MRILIVEDDRKAARFLRQALQEEGHAFDVAGDGEAGACLPPGPVRPAGRPLV